MLFAAIVEKWFKGRNILTVMNKERLGRNSLK
jgi:hypothetical protein